MKETGIVTDIKGELAVVKVERLIVTGGGCCGSTSRDSFFLEALNRCHARVGDHVRVESDFDKIRFRNFAQTGICIAAFTISSGIADAVLPLLGISAYKELLIVGPGMIMAAIALMIIRRFNKRSPPAVPVACGVAQSVAAQGELLAAP
ncbi:hypothetical protein AGMMS49587_01170 [Spirochaetia bacterium]|nr:hypothetical protein AGMMS49587_01170 [Spirochaetia bacterium]